MGYLYLALALIAGLTKGYCGKKTSGYTSRVSDAMAVNTVRMALCIGIGFLLLVINRQVTLLRPTVLLIAITALSGVATAAFVVSWLMAVRKGAYMMVEVFLMLGVLIPLLAGVFFLQEPVRPVQWIGFLILLGATWVMCSYSGDQKGSVTVSGLLLLIFCGASSGLADLAQKLFVRSIPDLPVSVFNFYTYVFAAAVLLPVWLATRRKEAPGTEKTLPTRLLGYILLMAVCLFVNSYFKTLAAGRLSTSQLYPLNQGASLVLSSVMTATVFKERMTGKAIFGIVLSFIGLILINLL